MSEEEEEDPMKIRDEMKAFFNATGSVFKIKNVVVHLGTLYFVILGTNIWFPYTRTAFEILKQAAEIEDEDSLNAYLCSTGFNKWTII